MTMIRGAVYYDNILPDTQGIPATSPIQKINAEWFRTDTMEVVDVKEMTYEQAKSLICETEE